MLFTKSKDSSFNAPIGSDVGEEDIDVTVHDQMLIIRGKQDEHKEEGQAFQHAAKKKRNWQLQPAQESVDQFGFPRGVRRHEQRARPVEALFVYPTEVGKLREAVFAMA